MEQTGERSPNCWWLAVDHDRLYNIGTKAHQKVKPGDRFIVVQTKDDDATDRDCGFAVLYRLGGRMVRGRKSEEGDTRVAPNGYHYTRESDSWELTHRLVAGRARGNPIRADERVSFIDGDRTNLDPDNLRITIVKPKTKAAKRAVIESKIDDLKARLDDLV